MSHGQVKTPYTGKISKLNGVLIKGQLGSVQGVLTLAAWIT